MTREELQRRLDALCALRGEPAGAVVVSAREDDRFKWVAIALPAEGTVHPLDIAARGDTEESAYDSAWAQASRYMEERTECANERVSAAYDELRKADTALVLARQLRAAAWRFSDG